MFVRSEASLKCKTARDALTPTGIADFLNLSPSSKVEVQKATRRGVNMTDGSASPDPNARNYFMEVTYLMTTPLRVCVRACVRAGGGGGTIGDG